MKHHQIPVVVVVASMAACFGNEDRDLVKENIDRFETNVDPETEAKAKDKLKKGKDQVVEAAEKTTEKTTNFVHEHARAIQLTSAAGTAFAAGFLAHKVGAGRKIQRASGQAVEKTHEIKRDIISPKLDELKDKAIHAFQANTLKGYQSSIENLTQALRELDEKNLEGPDGAHYLEAYWTQIRTLQIDTLLTLPIDGSSIECHDYTAALETTENVFQRLQSLSRKFGQNEMTKFLNDAVRRIDIRLRKLYDPEPLGGKH